MAKKVVFVGNSNQLKSLRYMSYFFGLNNWEVYTSESITSAKVLEPDLLVVYAYAYDHVEDFNQWTRHPPTVWFCFSRLDTVPIGTKEIRAVITPSQLYLECLKILVT